MKQRILVFLVLLLFFSNSVTGQIPTLPPGVLFPDNIVAADCYIDPPGSPFNFRQLAVSTQEVVGHGLPLVGDIDNDGIIEIIAPAGPYQGVSGSSLRIFKFKDGQLILQQTLNTPYFSIKSLPYSIAKVDGDDYAAIFLCTGSSYNTSSGDQRKLIKYVYNSVSGLYEEFKVNGNPKRGTYSALSNKEMAQPMIVDFNGDGIPEIVTYDKAFNAKTMELLVDGGLLQYANSAGDAAMGFGLGGHINNQQTSESGSFMAIGDMDNDGVPEVIGGNCVYKVNITNPAGISGNSFTLWSKCDKTGPNGETHNEAFDGSTAIADMDGDGYLDVVVITHPFRNAAQSGRGAVYIWNPRTQKVMHKNQIINIAALSYGGGWSGPSAPFIGDIDGDGEPEICFTGYRIMHAVEYNRNDKTISTKWSIGTNDTSAATTMSLFDFNQDKSYELVYRDEAQLRIIKGVDGSNLITPISCGSSTGSEYPVVADVNGDGAAEIIVTGNNRLYVFSSNPVGLWAPARKVWNQFAYNAININEDLTVPRKQFNPATRFPGSLGVLGDANDVYPFNGYLMQQTTLSQDGVPVWSVPNGQIVGFPTFTYDNITDKMTVTLQVKNAGEASFGNPFYVTTYKDNIGNATKYTYQYQNTISVGETATITFELSNYSTVWSPNSGIFFKINDNGNSLNHQVVCNDDLSVINNLGISPIYQDVCIGNIGELTCGFTLPGGTNTYQWESSKDDQTWIPITGATANKYTPANQKRGETYYRVVVTAGGDTESSSSAKIRVRSCRLPVNHNISVMGYYD